MLAGARSGDGAGIAGREDVEGLLAVVLGFLRVTKCLISAVEQLVTFEVVTTQFKGTQQVLLGFFPELHGDENFAACCENI